MTVSARQAYYLDAMGISLWREKNSDPGTGSGPRDAPLLSWQLPRGALSLWLSKQPVAQRHQIHSAQSQLIIISDWQAVDENAQSLFNGQSGDLLEGMLKAINLSRQQVGTIGLARAAGGELQSVETVLVGVPVKVILFMCALPETCSVEDFAGRGPVGQTCFEVPLIPSLHPAYLLVNDSAKRLAWEDLKQVRSLLLG